MGAQQLFIDLGGIVDPQEVDLPEKAALAIDGIKVALADGNTSLCQAFSSGKDSTVSASLMLVALAQAAEEGWLNPEVPHFIVSCDTQVENPLVIKQIHAQHQSMREFAAKYGINLETHIAQPTLAASFQVSIIGGRRPMPMPGLSSACSADWKVQPAQRLMARLKKERQAKYRAVTLLGSRLDEGSKRAGNLEKQNASHGCQVSEHDGNLLMYPVIDFTTENVFDYLMYAREYQPRQINNPFPTYAKNQTGIIKMYNDAVGECSLFDDKGKKTKGCNARTGCYVCGMAGKEDKSLKNAAEENASELLPLVAFRDYLMAVSEDPGCRNYLGTLPSKDDNESVNAGALGFCGKIGLNLLRYLLTIQAEEEERAWAKSEKPTFQPFTLQHIVALDYQWSLRGAQQKPWMAMQTWHEVMEMGKRYPIKPHVHSGIQKIPHMSTLKLPEDATHYWRDVQSPMAIMFDVHARKGQSFDVCQDGAELMYAFEYERLSKSEMTHRAAVDTLTGYGTVQIPSSKFKEAGIRMALVDRLEEAGLLHHVYEGGPLSPAAEEDLDNIKVGDLFG